MGGTCSKKRINKEMEVYLYSQISIITGRKLYIISADVINNNQKDYKYKIVDVQIGNDFAKSKWELIKKHDLCKVVNGKNRYGLYIITNDQNKGERYYKDDYF